MAIQLATFVSGSINNVVFYKLGDKYVARSKPAVVKQTAATQIRSKNFGIAATAGRLLRSQLQPVLPFPKDKNMQRRFSGAIANWLQLSNVQELQPAVDLPHIKGFSFNEATSVSERCRLPLNVTTGNNNQLQLHIPEFVPVQAITAPANTSAIHFNIICAGCSLTDANRYYQVQATITVPYSAAPVQAQSIDLPIHSATGDLVLTALTLTYLLNNGTPDNRNNFMPANVIDARYF